MTITLKPETQKLLDRLVAEGQFSSAEDAIHYALSATEGYEAGLDWDRINEALDEADAQIARREYVELRSKAELKAFFDDVVRRGKERLVAKTKKAG